MPYTYKVSGETVELKVDPTSIAIRFFDEAPNSARSLSVENSGAGPYSTRLDLPKEKICIVPVSVAGVAVDKRMEAIENLGLSPEVENVSAVFRLGNNKVVTTNRVLIGVENMKIIDALMEKHKLKVLSERYGTYLCEVDPQTEMFKLCAEIDSDVEVQFVEPEFIVIGRSLPQSPDGKNALAVDNFTADQFAMRLTKANDAWTVQLGDPSILIAILDLGVDSSHRDLNPLIVTSYDGLNGDSYQEPKAWDAHGTSCAGLAVGGGIEGQGVLGAGLGCSLMPVKIGYSPSSGAASIMSTEVISRSIDWAWENGASVISNSWIEVTTSNAIVKAIERARIYGRDGKGSVVVAAAGNYSNQVQFPANIDGVLAVSASNECDEIKTYSSSDGEDWWGTCFGPEIDVAAPGVHNFTSDNVGTNGYDPGDYYSSFNGTSSATPIVAGACGLVLSADPNLSESEVRTIIKHTADKVGGISYIDGRNDFFGDGRLNTLKAVELAQNNQ